MNTLKYIKEKNAKTIPALHLCPPQARTLKSSMVVVVEVVEAATPTTEESSSYLHSSKLGAKSNGMLGGKCNRAS